MIDTQVATEQTIIDRLKNRIDEVFFANEMCFTGGDEKILYGELRLTLDRFGKEVGAVFHGEVVEADKIRFDDEEGKETL